MDAVEFPGEIEPGGVAGVGFGGVGFDFGGVEAEAVGFGGVFAGVLLLSSIDTAINVMGLPPHFMQVIRGGLVLAAVLLDSLKNVIRARYL